MRQVVNIVTGEITFEEDAPVVEQTPEQIQSQINQEALVYLASTDWYVTRFTETGVAIPDAIKTIRQEARDKII